jgi:RNA polymerase sigma-B factor
MSATISATTDDTSSNVVRLPSATTAPRSGQERTERTRELLEQLAGAQGAMRRHLLDQIVEANLPLARSIARRYAGRGIAVDDLEQVAALALVSAAKRFDPARGADFFAYAVPTIKGELRKHFRDAGWVVRPPRRLQELQARLWAAEQDLGQVLGRPATPAEIAEHLEVDLDEVLEALGLSGCFSTASLDVPLGEDGATYADLQGEEDGAFEQCDARVALGPLVRNLSERDRRILELRFFRNWSQQRIGEEIGVTQMQVSRLLSRILGQLRTALEDEGSARTA